MIVIKNKGIPATPRSKNYPQGAVVTSAGGGAATAVVDSGNSIQIIKEVESASLSDKNVLSSLRTLLEIRKRIISKTDVDTDLSDENTLSSLRTIAEIDAAIIEALKTVDDTYLNKTKEDTASELITFLKGLLIGDNTASISEDGDAEVRNLIARIKATVAELEVTGPQKQIL
ncbi:hypothetical protein [uncultured Bacteroides sp.]|uniref:hypothetical protein n=1 Tax=uncultured Bacteroides sp. TaxID=162156 RepID=UPI002AA66614|nr:hypothetical protein [uncultured Bacteroides sp.]